MGHSLMQKLLLLLILPAATWAQNVPANYEIVFTGSQSPPGQRFANAYRYNLALAGAQTLTECAAICSRNPECYGIFFLVVSAPSETNCHILSEASVNEEVRNTPTESYSLRRLSFEEEEDQPTEQPPEESRDTGFNLDGMHWAWWIVIALLPLVCYVIYLCWKKARSKNNYDYSDDDLLDSEDEDEDEADRTVDKKDGAWDDGELEAGLFADYGATALRSSTKLDLVSSADRELSFFYETVAQHMQQERMGWAEEGDSSHDAFDADRYLSRVSHIHSPVEEGRQGRAARGRAQAGAADESSSSSNLSVPSILELPAGNALALADVDLDLGAPSGHFYPEATDTEDALSVDLGAFGGSDLALDEGHVFHLDEC